MSTRNRNRSLRVQPAITRPCRRGRVRALAPASPTARDPVHEQEQPANLQAFLRDLAQTPPDSPARQALAAVPGMAHLTNNLPAAAAGPVSSDQHEALLRTINTMAAQLNQIQATQKAQAIKPVPEAPTLKDPALQAAATGAVEAIQLSPEDGPVRAEFTLKIEACKKLDGITIAGCQITEKIDLLSDVVSWIKENPKLSDSELQTKILTVGSVKGTLQLVSGPLAALSVAAAGLPGLGGLPNPLAANAMMTQLAAMQTYQAAAAAAQTAVPATVPTVAGQQAAGTVLQLPVTAPGMLMGQYGLQQPSVQFVMPSVAAPAGQATGGQRKQVRCYACQQLGHYASRCPAKSAASGPNATAIVPRQ